MNFEQFFNEQAEWSQKEFGSDQEKGPVGALRHLAKEVGEAIVETDQDRRLVEMADMIFLIFDSHRRAGGTFGDLDAATNLSLTAHGELAGVQEQVGVLLEGAGEPDFKEGVVMGGGTGGMLLDTIMACWKFGFSRDQLLKACFDKLALNRTRTWVKPTGDDQPVEHDRSKD